MLILRLCSSLIDKWNSQSLISVASFHLHIIIFSLFYGVSSFSTICPWIYSFTFIWYSEGDCSHLLLAVFLQLEDNLSQTRRAVTTIIKRSLLLFSKRVTRGKFNKYTYFSLKLNLFFYYVSPKTYNLSLKCDWCSCWQWESLICGILLDRVHLLPG